MVGAVLYLTAALLAAEHAAPHGGTSPWEGTWTFDSCHEDRKAGHDARTYCREGMDRILIARGQTGRHDITLCPADPWGERDVTLGPGGRSLSFRTREGLVVQLEMGEDRAHFRGVFRSPGGHSGRAWGRRVPGCR